ncbi:hypothetical protein P8452_16264 [Trifolium repens]|nr:hypothetical protein P8452_16264 [Trifolium repens]
MEVLLKLFGGTLNSITSKCMVLFVTVLILRVVFFPSFDGIEWRSLVYIHNHSQPSTSSSEFGIRPFKFLVVPQLVWGLNNQKIAFTRVCLTARMLNRTLLMPSFSASLFYKEIELLQPISFDKVFQFEKFNALCSGFVREWTLDRDLSQLKEYSKGSYDDYEVIEILGKNPFLWHDHWPLMDYAKVFECLVLIDEIRNEVEKVVSRIREVGNTGSIELQKGRSSFRPLPYVAVHMRIEIDWMIHCKKLEQRLNTNQICSSKKEIVERVKNIVIGLKKTPTVIYLAVADKLLNNSSIMEDWGERFLPYEKKKLGVEGIYKKYSYLIQSAIDYEVCLQADIFVGNSFSTFSSLVVLERTNKMIRMSVASMCGTDVRWPSYAYNVPGESNGAMRWITNMSESSLQTISYGTDHVSNCKGHI